jgi:hypothetical protein
MKKGFYQFPRYFFLDKKVTQKIKTAITMPVLTSPSEKYDCLGRGSLKSLMPLTSFLRYFFLDKKVTQKIKATATVRPTIGSFAKQKELALCAQTTFCFTLTSPCGFPAPSPMPVLTSPMERLGWLGGGSLESLMSLESLKSLMTLFEKKEITNKYLSHHLNYYRNEKNVPNYDRALHVERNGFRTKRNSRSANLGSI